MERLYPNLSFFIRLHKIWTQLWPLEKAASSAPSSKYSYLSQVIVAVLEREQKALPAKKAAFLSSAMVRMWVWASSMVILHPCMELDPTLRLAFWRAELSLAVMGSDRVCPILHTKFGFWSLLTHFHSFLFLLTPLHWNDHWLCHFLLSITQNDNTKKNRCSSTLIEEGVSWPCLWLQSSQVWSLTQFQFL